MNRFFRIVSAGMLTAMVGATAASADEFLGSYVARITDHDKQASDGYALDTAAQMVRQDRANFHKFHDTDPDDENDVWFRTNDQRARLERMLGQGGAMGASTRRAISNGEPLIQVDVYRNHVEVTIIG
jgi:murein tripeptide amidase MpaA